MHEVSIAQALIDQVDAEVEKSGHCGTVVSLDIVVGRMSGVHVDSLRFAFELISPDTVVDGAELRIEQTRAASLCPACGAREEIDEILPCCAACGSAEITIEGGRELMLQSIELEDAA